MLAIPRLDVRAGFAVRPGGSDGTILGDPVSIVRNLVHAGFHRIHIADLDALAGQGSNADIVEDLIRDGSAEIEVADGAESADQIERYASAGATRIVLGTRALDDRDWLAGVTGLYPGLLVVATDVRERRVATRGWIRTLPLDVLDVASELSDLPLGGLLVSRAADGSRSLDLSLLEDVAEATSCPVLADAPFATANDLRALEHRGIAAAILGGAIYSGELDARHVAMEFADESA